MGVNFSDLAAVSRIRVEVRGGSMEAAEKAAFAILTHAQMAGYLEGLCPQGGNYTDHHFDRPIVKRTMGDGPEVWTELGLPYAGRLTFTYEPEVVRGGLQQYGFKVEQVEPFAPTEGNGFIVLDRLVPVTREHSWDGRPPWRPPFGVETAESVIEDIRSITDVIGVTGKVGADGASVSVEMDGWSTVTRGAETLHEAANIARDAVIEVLRAAEEREATAEEIIANIERLIGVDSVAMREITKRDGDGGPVVHHEWRVIVTFTDERAAVEGRGFTKRDAALEAYGLCGVDVTHYDTHERVEIPLEDLREDMLAAALADKPYKTIIVGPGDAAKRARAILDNAESALHDALRIKLDTGQDRDAFVLTTEELPVPEGSAGSGGFTSKITRSTAS